MDPVVAMEASTAPVMETSALAVKLTNSSSEEQLSNTSISDSSATSTSSHGAEAPSLDTEDFNVSGGCLKSKPEGCSIGETKKVSFASIDLHMHEITLGDNAAVSSGPPLSLSWKAVEHFNLSLDDYENYRAVPRKKYEMLLPRTEREDRLRAVGYSRGELREASQEAAAIRLQRLKSSRDGALKRRIAQWVKPSKPTNSLLEVTKTNSSTDFARATV